MKFKTMTDLTAQDKAEYVNLDLKLASYDDGYYGVKVFSDDVPNGAVLRSLVGATSQRMSRSSDLLGPTTIPGVEIKDGPTRYLFGLHADQQMGLEHLTTKSSDDVTFGSIRLQQFFAAGLRTAFPAPGKYRVRVVVMMPVRAFQLDPEFKDSVKKTLCGIHSFEALTHFEDGEPIYEPFSFYVEDIVVIEQPLGSLLKVVFDPATGHSYDELKEARNVFLDWGAGTLDVFTTDAMSTRIDKMCGSAEAGIQLMFNYIRSGVMEKVRVRPTPMDLERAIMAGRYKDNRHPSMWSSLADENGFIDLNPFIQEGVDAMWKQALQLFDRTIGTTAETIDNIFITGGTSGWMQPYVLNHFGEHRVFEVMKTPVINPKLPYEHLMLSKDLHLRNAEGGYLLAQKLVKRI